MSISVCAFRSSRRQRSSTARRALSRAIRVGFVVAALICLCRAAVAGTPPWVRDRRVENVARLGEIITKIHFVGNETFGADELLLYMETQESTLFGIQHFNEKTFDRDLDNLERYYMSQGFFEAEVAAEDLAVSEDGLEIEILVGVFEGDRWSVAEISFEGNEDVSEEELLAATVLRPGSPLVSKDLTSDGRAVLQEYARRTYLDATASQHISRDDVARTGSIRYEIVERDTVSISEIRIVGQEKTKRYVIERELTVKPGEPFDPIKIGESQANIYGTGLFNAVWMEPAREDSGKDLRRLMVRVRERSSGYYDIRAGYATIDGFTVGAEITNRNVQGQGLRLSLNGTYSQIRRSVDVTATDPWFLGRKVTASLLAGHSWDDEVSYLGETTGGTVIFSRELAKTFTLDAGLEYTWTVVYDSKDAEHEEGTNTTSSVLVGATHDTRDDILNAKRGMFARARVDFATTLLGGTNDFMRPDLEWRGYRDIRGGRLGALLTRFAWIRSWEEMGGIPVNERFFAGGDGSVRGYPRNSLGPVDIAGTPTGGNALIELQGEIRFRGIGNWQLVVFVDAGQVYEELSTIDLSQLAVGAGPGLRYLTRIGALRFDAAYPVNNDGSWQFYFGIGQEF